MKISIFGMGYVGAVCAACLADQGHDIIGVDVSQDKIDLINQGQTPIVETGLGALLASSVKAGRVRATLDAFEAVMSTDVSMICVGTPSKRNGDLSLQYIVKVCEEIGDAIRAKGQYHTIVVRSTVLPGTVKEVVIPILEKSTGTQVGEGFGLAMNPEFLRESSAINDFYEPPMTVIGEYDEKSGDQVAAIYDGIEAPIIRKNIETAEMIKYTCNVWHAAKVTFANEIGKIAKAVGVDGREVMEVICTDTKLNISAYYMKPGFAFGGSCLPKDVRALNYRAGKEDVNTPFIQSIMTSNEAQINHAFELIAQTGLRKIAMLGLAFKSGTDDLRESPLVELAEKLIGKGYHLSIFDENVEVARVCGANKDYIVSKIPHVSDLLNNDVKHMVAEADLIILGNTDKKFGQILADLPPSKRVLDLVGFMPEKSTEHHEGIGW